MKPFTDWQKSFIEHGELMTKRLKDIVQAALGGSPLAVEVKRHTYIYSPPGAGKTFTVASAAMAAGVTPLEIRGTASIPGFARKLAYAVYKAQGNDIVVWVDDCDMLFADEQSLNVMKGVLDEEVSVLSWNKNIAAQINRDVASSDPHTQQIGLAMKSFQEPGSPGVDIPTNNVRFIITSNKDLCEPGMVGLPGKAVSKRLMHEAAIRDRVNYHSFSLTRRESWGWLAATLLDPACNLSGVSGVSSREIPMAIPATT